MGLFNTLLCVTVIGWLLCGIQIYNGECVPHHNITVSVCPQNWSHITQLTLPDGIYSTNKLCCDQRSGNIACHISKFAEEIIIDSSLPAIILTLSVFTCFFITFGLIMLLFDKAEKVNNNYTITLGKAYCFAGIFTLTSFILWSQTYKVFIVMNLC